MNPGVTNAPSALISLVPLARNTAHVSDRIPTDRQITCVGFVKSAVYDGAASNYNIVRHNVCLEAVETCERQTSVYRSCAKISGAFIVAASMKLPVI